MPYLLGHWVIVWVYLLLPIAVVARVWFLPREKRTEIGQGLLLTGLAAALVAGSVCGAYAVMSGGAINPWEAIKAIYFAFGMMMILKGFDWLLRRAVEKLGVMGTTVRVVILFGVGLPYVMACAMTYRPRVALTDDPTRQLGYPFERVSFSAMDGTEIQGWWIPAGKGSNRKGPPREDDGTRTVVVCHGLAANKSNQLVMASHFVPYGYNVLIFDFRAHGESSGQMTTFGDRERFDVLGAVRWLRAHWPEQAQRIYGVGASMGAAALIAAGADDSEEGRAIEAIAVYGTYARVDSLVKHVARDYFFQPLRWLTENIAVPMASWQTGSDLRAFAPAELVEGLWPRPVMIIHGMADEIIHFDEGQDLFRAASVPKQRIWIEKGDHNSVINSPAATEAVRQFFDHAQAVPVI
jgi:alpha-beta hydrolase superfamily lysophospholipase